MSGPHWIPLPIGEVRAEDRYEYLWMDVSLSTVDKLPLIITGKGQ